VSTPPRRDRIHGLNPLKAGLVRSPLANLGGEQASLPVPPFPE
jgi:hypothetical protein